MKIRILLRSFSLAALLLPATVVAQVSAGPDTVSCGTPVTLTADIFNRPSTTNYSVSPITYAPFSFTSGTVVPLTDDGYTSALPIGFPFCFFGQLYNQFHISANGWISFTPANQFAQVNNNPSAFPSSSNNVPKNAIAIWEDWNPPQGGTVNYYTTGTMPNRKLVVNWNNVPHYSCTGQLLKAQVVLYEGTNIIEYHIASKGSCPTWQSGNATQGIQNQNGTQAFTVPGRNASIFTLTNDAYRFAPAGVPETPTIKWFNLTAGGPPISSGPSISVNPAATTTYSVEVNYSCSPGLFRDTVIVTLDKTTLSVTKTDVSCFGGSDGTALVSVSGSLPPYSYSWSSNPVLTGSSAAGLSSGLYYIDVTHGACLFRDSVTINEPAAIELTTGSVSATCGDTNGIAFVEAAGGEGPYQYSWNTGIFNDSLINITEGSYSVTVTDNNGCTSSANVTVSSASGVNAGFQASVYSGNAPLTVTFTNTSSGAEVYLWDFGNGSTSASPQNASAEYTLPGTYIVTITATHNGICSDTYSETITVTKDSVPEVEPVLIPNVLNLNSTVESNRLFKIRGSLLEEVNMNIFNRWGKEVFSSNDLTQGWDGGTEAPGTYYYIITYREQNNEPVTVKGFLMLFR